MKRLLFTSMILAGVLLAQTGFSQVYIHANVSFGQRGVFCPAPAPRVIYQQVYSGPVPYYSNYYNNRIIVDRGYQYDRSRYKGERYDRQVRERRHDRW